MLTSDQINELRSSAGFSPTPTTSPSLQGGDVGSALKSAASEFDKQKNINTPEQKSQQYSDIPGSDTAGIMSRPANTANPFAEGTKIIPNALKDSLDLLKSGTYGTAKNLFNIVKEGAGVISDVAQHPETVGAMAQGAGESALKSLWNLVPQSAKELANTKGMAEIPSQFQSLAKESGGYANAFVNLVKAAPESVRQGVLDYTNQLDRARQAFVNHPLIETLGWLGLKSLATEPKATIEQAKQGLDLTTEAITHPIDTMKSVGGDIKENYNPLNVASELKQKIQTKTGEYNVSPQLETSAKRLSENPVATYDDFYNKAVSSQKNIKADTPLSVVGEKIGNAFDNVIKMRQDVGKQMAGELENVKNVPLDITDNFVNLENSLKDEANLGYDANKGKLFSTTKQSKITLQDKMLLEKYIGDLNDLGAKPTVGDLDSFMKRVPDELKIYKAKNNITDVTNGERIIKNNLSQLRNKLSPEVNGQPELRGYYDMRQAYSTLSDFLDDGVKFMGKKTQAGDYTKDASLAKSSVQSILNNGKKDWLSTLEGLTNYPALDESVLALQAMKDAGDFRGISLLEKLQGETLPITTHGIAAKALEMIIKGGKRVLAGTTPDQTRAFLKSISNKNR